MCRLRCSLHPAVAVPAPGDAVVVDPLQGAVRRADEVVGAVGGGGGRMRRGRGSAATAGRAAVVVDRVVADLGRRGGCRAAGRRSAGRRSPTTSRWKSGTARRGGAVRPGAPPVTAISCGRASTRRINGASRCRHRRRARRIQFTDRLPAVPRFRQVRLLQHGAGHGGVARTRRGCSPGRRQRLPDRAADWYGTVRPDRPAASYGGRRGPVPPPRRSGPGRAVAGPAGPAAGAAGEWGMRAGSVRTAGSRLSSRSCNCSSVTARSPCRWPSSRSRSTSQ